MIARLFATPEDAASGGIILLYAVLGIDRSRLPPGIPPSYGRRVLIVCRFLSSASASFGKVLTFIKPGKSSEAVNNSAL